MDEKDINQKPNPNNPTPEQAEASASKLTGEALLKKIQACKEETKDILQRVPGKIEKETFDNVMNQIENDQVICVKYIDLLSGSIKNLKEAEVGNLPDALSATKARIAGEIRMVRVLKNSNPFEGNLSEKEIQSKKMEEAYTLNAFISMGRGQEEVEWMKYKTFTSEREQKMASQSQETSSSEGIGFTGILVLFFVLFVIIKRSTWGKSLYDKVVKATTEASSDQSLSNQQNKDKDKNNP